MNSIRRWHSGLPRAARKPDALRVMALVAAIAVSVAAWFAFGDGATGATAFTGAQQGAQASAQAQASGPEANLPYLFAVYIITWAAFFAYVFYVSRRQREMQAEIDALKRALEERDAS